MFKGSYCALATPFKGGRFDEDAFRALLGRQIAGGSAGVVPCGTTGEAPTLSPQEHLAVVRAAVAEARGRLPVIAVGTNSTQKTVEQAEEIGRAKPDAFLVTAPYYNKPTQQGLYLHFKAVAAAARRPVMVYNIPGRTAVNIQPATVARLAKDCPNIVAVKEASGSVEQAGELLALLPGRFSVLSGDDALTLPMMALGARGVVSVLANLVPRQTARLCALAAAGRRGEAAALHRGLLPLTKALFLETNPIPLKAALAMLGLCSEELRLPLCPLSRPARAALRAVLPRAL